MRGFLVITVQSSNHFIAELIKADRFSNFRAEVKEAW